VESQTAAARSAMATAAVHVARSEERSAALEQVAANIAQQALTAAEVAFETDRIVAEQQRREDEMRREREAEELQLKRQQQKTTAAAAANAVAVIVADDDDKLKSNKQQEQAVDKTVKANKQHTETAQNKKRSLRTRDDNKVQTDELDLSSWPCFT